MKINLNKIQRKKYLKGPDEGKPETQNVGK